MISQTTVAAIVERDLHGTLVARKDLVTGYVGRLYAITVKQGDSERQLCIKFTETTNEAAYDDLSVDERIYAARPSNFHGAYNDTRPLFQLYYLLSWLPVFYHAAQTNPASMRATIATGENLILQIIHPYSV